MDHNLLQNALVYLLAAVVAVPIAKRLGLGAVLGYLLAGIAIGPWGLRLISGVENILHFSEFGVVLLLFLIGLELEPKRLWAMRRPIFGGGGAQVLLVAAALAGTALLFGIAWKVALIAALGLSLSSTAIALATLEERNLMATPAGAAGFSILLFQDIAAIPMIAIVPMLGVAAGENSTSWLDVAQIVAVIAALVLGGRFLIRPALRMIAKTGMREIFTAFALLLVIAIAMLMQWVGLSMALGMAHSGHGRPVSWNQGIGAVSAGHEAGHRPPPACAVCVRAGAGRRICLRGVRRRRHGAGVQRGTGGGAGGDGHAVDDGHAAVAAMA
jgi:glutathione-regulated potassium-efflux system ancillary protein KefC